MARIYRGTDEYVAGDPDVNAALEALAEKIAAKARAAYATTAKRRTGQSTITVEEDLGGTGNNKDWFVVHDDPNGGALAQAFGRPNTRPHAGLDPLGKALIGD